MKWEKTVDITLRNLELRIFKLEEFMQTFLKVLGNIVEEKRVKQ
jgi:hypothetical protein